MSTTLRRELGQYFPSSGRRGTPRSSTPGRSKVFGTVPADDGRGTVFENESSVTKTLVPVDTDLRDSSQKGERQGTVVHEGRGTRTRRSEVLPQKHGLNPQRRSCGILYPSRQKTTRNSGSLSTFPNRLTSDPTSRESVYVVRLHASDTHHIQGCSSRSYTYSRTRD